MIVKEHIEKFTRGGDPYRKLGVGLTPTDMVIEQVIHDIKEHFKDNKDEKWINLELVYTLYNDAFFIVKIEPSTVYGHKRRTLSHSIHNITLSYKHADWVFPQNTKINLIFRRELEEMALEPFQRDSISHPHVRNFLDVFAKPEFGGMREIAKYKTI